MALLQKTRNQLKATLSVNRRRESPWNSPTHIFLEVTNRCNLACVMCGRTHDKRYKDEQFVGDISLETVQKLDRFYGPSTFVTATGLGEPFLHPQIIPILAHLKSRGAVVSLTSNGTLLSEEVTRKLIANKVDRIVFSIDSPDPQEFSRIRVGARLDDVLENVARLSRLRSQATSRHPYLILEFVAMARNFHQLPAVAEMAHKLKLNEVIVQNLFKTFDAGYDAFYQQNKLSILDPQVTAEIWGTFTARLGSYKIRLYSPFAKGGLAAFLGRQSGTSKPERARKSTSKFLGYIDRPTPREHVFGHCPVSGWVMGRRGKPIVEVCLESDVSTIMTRVALEGPRPDVLTVLPEDFAQLADCGFETILDVSALDAGVYTLFLRVREDENAQPAILDRRQIFVKDRGNYEMYCTQPWSTFYVTWDGKVRTCCFHEYSLGDLNGTSADDLWSGPAFRKLRGQVVSGHVIPECMDCLAGKSNPNYIRPWQEWAIPHRIRNLRSGN